MTKCFLIPMTEPPYSMRDNQRPKYVNEIGQINWSGMPLFKSKMYVIKANADENKLLQLQSSDGVIDFPNIDDDILDSLPENRKIKDKEIKKILKLKDENDEKVKDFINRCANSEFNHGWDKDGVFVFGQ